MELANASITLTLDMGDPNNVGLGEPCVPNSSMTCTAKSECISGICQCSSGLVQLDQRCIKQWAGTFRSIGVYKTW